ncbi:TetR family transcriptional regulator [Streptomyces chrestomyceticus JCM 4735]|uniref:TetR family transcriptional regulator n=1 Tax=Streptomyces chrestomyceticus JCM 4735 TaxID=1306181 RepID=A0A7U9KSU3_9ACTN|nr:TetR/AcrR family transcriptional regulator [Streptomyces chrestomyceticus]GCD34646.1 TetR family transcriptional regulator [Streptomyces chrestomyceticus JCM 4735]
MGHREDLLEGAKRCLLEKGYARTTARDIVAASGTNLASIGYHYGSKDVLMRKALVESVEEWGAGLAGTEEAGGGEAAGDPVERFAAGWDRILRSFLEQRDFVASQVEVLGLLPRDPELRAALATVLPEGGEGLVAVFENVPDTEVDAESARVVGSFYQALLTGLMVQSLVSPAALPSGGDLVEAMRRVLSGTVLSASARGPEEERTGGGAAAS